MVMIIRNNLEECTEACVHPLDVIEELETPFVAGEPGNVPVDMYEYKDELVIRAELPGFKSEDIDLRFERDTLSIGANKKEETMEEVTYLIRERWDGSYVRLLPLPFPVNGDKFVATFENGLLEIRVPKAQEAKTKHIEIKG